MLCFVCACFSNWTCGQQFGRVHTFRPTFAGFSNSSQASLHLQLVRRKSAYASSLQNIARFSAPRSCPYLTSMNDRTPPGSQTRKCPRSYAIHRLATCPWTSIAIVVLTRVSVEIVATHGVSITRSGSYQHLLQWPSRGVQNGLSYRRCRRRSHDLLSSKLPPPSSNHRTRRTAASCLLLLGIYTAVLVRFSARNLGRTTRSVMCHTPKRCLFFALTTSTARTRRTIDFFTKATASLGDNFLNKSNANHRFKFSFTSSPN